MTTDVSTLGIVVKSDGIEEAKRALVGGNGSGGLFKAAEKTEKAVVKLTDSLQKMMQLNTTGTTAAWSAAMGQLQSSMAALNSSVAATVRALQSLAPAMNGAIIQGQNFAVANERSAYSGNVVVNTLKAMATAATVYKGIQLGISVVKEADSWALMQAKLRNATGSMQNAVVAQNQLYELSQQIRVPLEETARLYTRLAPSIQRAGKSSEYAKDMVEGISTALQLSGATGGEAASVMLQLSQSFSSGVLNGAEFNAVAENGSVLMRALERSTGKTTSELKKLGSTGALSMDLVGKAIQENLPMWREQFDRLPVTFEGAMTRIKNAWAKAIGEMGQDTGFNKQISSGLRDIEEMLPAIAKEIGKLFIDITAWLKESKGTLGEIWEQIKGLVGDVLDLGKKIAGVTGAIIGMGQEFSVVGFAIFSLRLGIAGLSDGFSHVMGVVSALGALIIKGLVDPVIWFVDMFHGTIADVISAASGMLANLAEKAGMTGTAKMYRGISDAAKEMSTSLTNVKMTAKGIGEALKNQASQTYENFMNGKSAVQALLNEEVKLYEARDKFNGKMNEEDWQANNPANTSKAVDSKAVKAEAARLKKYQEQAGALLDQIEAQRELIANLTQYGLAYDKINPAQKEAIKYEREYNNLVRSSADAKVKDAAYVLMIQAQEAAALSTTAERIKEQLTLEAAITQKRQTSLDTAKQAAVEAERKLQTYGMEKGAIDELALADTNRLIMAMELQKTYWKLTADEQKQLDILKETARFQKQTVDANTAIGQLDAQAEFDKLFDPKKAEKFGDALATGFGTAGNALGKLMNSLGKYEARMSKIDKARKIAAKETDPVKQGKMYEKIIAEETESRLASYADMAGAAKSFFKEGTAGYRAMQGAEAAFRVFQMALQIKSFLQESGFIQAITSLFVASESTKASAAVASAATTSAAALAQGQASATAGVANQALGDPYTAFTRMAAMAALMTAIGFAVNGGGGGKSIAKARQEAQGTGTVFGDSSAKSNSISNSLEILKDNSDIALKYSSGMLSSLQSIEQSLTGAVSGVIRTGGSLTGKGFSNSKDPLGGFGGTIGATAFAGLWGLGASLATKLPLIGGIASKVLGSLFGSSKTLKDAGLMGSNQSVADILSNGFSVKGYQDVQTKKKAFGFTYSDKTKTTTQAVDPAISNEFSNIVEGMVSTLTDAGKVLGFSEETIRKKLEAANINIGKISLKDLSSEEIQKQLEAVFSAIGDNLTNLALPSVAQFQKAGEGLLETAVRVATGVETANYELEKLGLRAINYTDITNKNGDVGAEIVRQSILAVEAATGVGKIISGLTGTATEIAKTYSSLVEVRDSLKALGIAGDVSSDLIRAAGGLEALQDSLSTYTDNFYSDTEKNAMATASLQKEFAKLGLTMPASKAAFRSLVDQLSASGASGQELAVKVIALAGAFSDLDSSTENLLSTAKDDLRSAYEDQVDSLNEVIDKFKEFSASLKDFKTSLLTGDMSTLDVAGKYSVSKSKYDETLAKALAGDQTAIGDFQSVAEAYLQASREMFASGPQYTSDFNSVLAAIDAVTKVSDSMVTDTEKQLDLLNKQVQGLIDINTSVLTVAQAIDNLLALMGGKPVSSTPVGTNASIDPVTNKATAMSVTAPVSDSLAPVVAELSGQVASLKEQLQALRTEQAAQTEALITATAVSAAENAVTVVQGSKEAASISAYNSTRKVALA